MTYINKSVVNATGNLYITDVSGTTFDSYGNEIISKHVFTKW